MDSKIVPKSFGCFPRKGLKLTLPRLKSKSSSNSSSPRSNSTSPITPKNTRREVELREVFRRFDNDNDGKISAVEIRAYFGSIGEYMSYEEAKGVIDELDTDGDELIDFGDFMRLMKKGEGGGGDQEEADEDIKAAFGIFEFEKGCGRITPKSLQRALSRLGESRSYDECAAMIRVFDVDGNGELDFYEFHQMMA